MCDIWIEEEVQRGISLMKRRKRAGDKVKSREDEVEKVLGGLNRLFGCRSLRIDIHRRLCVGITVHTALYGEET